MGLAEMSQGVALRCDVSALQAEGVNSGLLLWLAGGLYEEISNQSGYN